MNCLAEATISWWSQSAYYDFFTSAIRPGLFTGFLTISGFLFSAHTFIVVHMKKEVYESERYRTRITHKRKTNKEFAYYGSLRRLSRYLMTTVAVALATSLCQVTLGLYAKNWVAVVCLGMAAFSFVMLVGSILIMGLNLQEWFNDLEEDQKAAKE